ncbi:MAG: hypothetical protein FJ221_18490 [Lentisphaerae bacterium]|nr:hypothetical protein [Lentisphaerota bacterium]
MKIVALIDHRAVIERILRHLGLWGQGVRVTLSIGPPCSTVIGPWLDDPFPACHVVARRAETGPRRRKGRGIRDG